MSSSAAQIPRLREALAETNRKLVDREELMIGDLVWGRVKPHTWCPGIVLRIHDQEHVILILLDDEFSHTTVPASGCKHFTPNGATTGAAAPVGTEYPSAVHRACEEYTKRMVLAVGGEKPDFSHLLSQNIYAGPSVHGKEQLQAWLTKQFTQILTDMEKEDTHRWFKDPVEATFNVPNYSKVVSTPMDFVTMRANLRKGTYQTLDDFFRDLKLVFDNSIAYNTLNTVYGVEALRLKTIAEQKVSNKIVLLDGILREEEDIERTAQAVVTILNDPGRQQRLDHFRSLVAAAAVSQPPSRGRHPTTPQANDRSASSKQQQPSPSTVGAPSSQTMPHPISTNPAFEMLVQYLIKEQNHFSFEAKTFVRIPKQKQITVSAILNQFEKAALSRDALSASDRQRVKEVVSGVRNNFLEACLKCLMYPCELTAMRTYFRMGLGDTDPPVSVLDIFGAEHLLRMLVHLPGKLDAAASSSTSAFALRPETVAKYKLILDQLLGFLSVHFVQFFDQ